MSLPTFIRPHENGVYLAVKVQPRASKNEIGEVVGDELKIKVTAPPVDAAANQAVIDLLAKEFKLARSAIAHRSSQEETVLLHHLGWR